MADQSDNSSPLAPITRILANFANNLSATLSSASTTDYIRLTAIVGGYLLIRPYLQKLGARYQERDHARTVDASEESSMAATGVKARVVAGEEDSDDDSDGEGWGRGKRLQQREQRARRRREIEENTARGGFDDEEDKDIEEFLQN
ncbi:hypothetical protein TWF696_004168 [Orbilia brochopaga]|uniref:DUF1531-domain-containing protein n=1 Tax=Orbilia brochopaga TaxID=3140254 RepID=A0AAV9V5B9_9PEZI